MCEWVIKFISLFQTVCMQCSCRWSSTVRCWEICRCSDDQVQVPYTCVPDWKLTGQPVCQCNAIYAILPYTINYLAYSTNPLRQRKNGSQYADSNFKRIFFNENCWIFICLFLFYEGSYWQQVITGSCNGLELMTRDRYLNQSLPMSMSSYEPLGHSESIASRLMRY